MTYIPNVLTTANIEDAINDGVVNKAPSENAVYDALAGKQTSLGFTPENTANKDATSGYAGLTLFKINFKNVANTFISFFTNSNTAARTYTFKDADGTMAFTSDITNPPTTTAINDVQVGDGTGAWIKKTLAQFQTILGLGTAAYTASTDYAVTAKGVTNGDSHDHNGGDGAQINHTTLSNIGTNTHTQIDTFISTTAPATYQPLDSDLTDIAALTPSNDDVMQRKAGHWVSRTLAQLLADLPIAVGSWNPTLSNTTNVAASSVAANWWYARILSLVFGFGIVSQDPTTANILTTLGISIPIASNIGATNDLVGTATAIGGAGEHGGALFGDAANDRIILRTYPISAANQAWYCIFGYRII